MGTSKSYSAPTGPQWTPLKNEVTRVARKGVPDPEQSQNILNGFMKARGGATGGGSGSGSGGGGGASAIGVARDVGQRVGSFVSSLQQEGLAKALEGVGLPDLTGKSASEVGLAIVDYLGGPANTIDDVDARNALSSVMDEILSEAETYEDVENALDELADEAKLEGFLQKFFSCYLFEQFNRSFYERLVERFGAEKADSFMNGIRDYIDSSVRTRSQDKKLTSIDWNGQEGLSMAEDILNETFEIFGGTS